MTGRRSLIVIHVSQNNPAVLYYMDANELESSGVEKDLGVLVDKSLNLTIIEINTVKKLNQMVNALYIIQD